jgi:hypothetical protein
MIKLLVVPYPSFLNSHVAGNPIFIKLLQKQSCNGHMFTSHTVVLSARVSYAAHCSPSQRFITLALICYYSKDYLNL